MAPCQTLTLSIRTGIGLVAPSGHTQLVVLHSGPLGWAINALIGEVAWVFLVENLFQLHVCMTTLVADGDTASLGRPVTCALNVRGQVDPRTPHALPSQFPYLVLA